MHDLKELERRFLTEVLPLICKQVESFTESARVEALFAKVLKRGEATRGKCEHLIKQRVASKIKELLDQ